MASTLVPQAFESSRGIVKQVLSGDSVIVRGQPKGGPPPERQINFSNVSAPRLARRATNNLGETKDEPYAWESREFLRKKVIGKEVIFSIDPKSKTLNREYGNIYLGKDIETGENITELMVSEGWLSVRRESLRGENYLGQLEDQARSAKKGRWAGEESEHIRHIKWNIDNTRTLLDRLAGKKISAIIEHVRDGSTVRAFLLPDFYHVTLMVSGIRCPGVHMDGRRADPGTQEALGEQAKYFVESRVLQRDIHIVLETSNNNNFVGSIIHPSGNIAEALLREGFAKCVDWSMTTVFGGPDKLRAAEKSAKEKRLRLWSTYSPPANAVSDKEKEFTAKVIEIVNGDALVVQRGDSSQKKIFLASIRPPRLDENATKKPQSGKTFRPLYDIPYMYEAREFLRKKLIDQKVQVCVDYIQPAQNNYPEKVCCTVKLSDVNIAEALVQRGLATVIRYRQDDDQRAGHYDDLLSAESKAIKGGAGLHNKKDTAVTRHRFRDLSEPAEAKKNFSSFKRAGKLDAVPEFVASGSRMRVYVPKETCILTFLLAGIQCPRAPRPAPGGTGGTVAGEDFGTEAFNFTKTRVLQRQVQIEVESMDKGGNFIGWLFYDNGSRNLSVELVQHGLSHMHFTAEGTVHHAKLLQAEKNAIAANKNLFKDYTPPEQDKFTEKEDIPLDRKVDYRPMIITEVSADGKIYGQNVSDGAALQKISDSLHKTFTSNPPLPGSYKPKRGDICASKFVDGNWYRVKVEKVSGDKVHVFYLDFGNRQVNTMVKCAQLPMGLAQAPFYAKEMCMAFIKFHQEEDHLELAIDALRQETEVEVMVNTEWRASGTDYVTIQHRDKTDIAKKLLEQGMLLVEPKNDKRFASIVSSYTTAQEDARKNHRCIWQYGDITDDDAFEFGMEVKR